LWWRCEAFEALTSQGLLVFCEEARLFARGDIGKDEEATGLVSRE
jgi:hypothetical protein